MKTAVLQVADTGPLESLVVMLRAIGYRCTLPSEKLRNELRRIGCNTVLSPIDLQRGMGYQAPLHLPEVGIADMSRTDIVVFCVKAHRNYSRMVQRWPTLANRVCWYRINGGAPERVPGCGDEVTPPCPVVTPNLWYREDGPWKEKSYAFWPPFYRWSDYDHPRYDDKVHNDDQYAPPICLIHNFQGWGYGAMAEAIDRLGIQVYGKGSPAGLLQHKQVAVRLSNALAMVHFKSSDAPGYALYEALASGCPIVCSRRLIWRNRMQELFIPGKTCLVFDRETHDGLNQQDIDTCTKEIDEALKALRDRSYNRSIGEAGRERLRELMWSQARDNDRLGFYEFMKKWFH